MAEAYRVFVVLDRDYGERLLELPRSGPVWIVDTPQNRAAAQNLWAVNPNRNHLEGVTTFKAGQDCSNEETLINELDTIDLHHGSYSADPPYTVLEVIGVRLSDKLENELSRFGFNQFRATTEGFGAVRPVPSNRISEYGVMNDGHLAKIESEVRGFVRAAYPEMVVRAEYWTEDPSRIALFFIDERFRGLYARQRYHYLVQLIPSDYYRSTLADTVWFELAPDERPETIEHPDQELIESRVLGEKAGRPRKKRGRQLLVVVLIPEQDDRHRGLLFSQRVGELDTRNRLRVQVAEDHVDPAAPRDLETGIRATGAHHLGGQRRPRQQAS